jgi:hypothetical protein
VKVLRGDVRKLTLSAGAGDLRLGPGYHWLVAVSRLSPFVAGVFRMNVLL